MLDWLRIPVLFTRHRGAGDRRLLPALHPTAAGRTYAACGGLYGVVALLWL